MDAKQLAEIKAREQAATPGPWSVDTNEPFSRQINGVFADEQKRYVFYHDPDDDNTVSKNDAAFIAKARTDIPALVAEVERLKKENTSQVEYINELADSIDNWRKLVNEKNGKLVQRSKRIATLEKALLLMAMDLYECDDPCNTAIENALKNYIQQAQELEGQYEI